MEAVLLDTQQHSAHLHQSTFKLCNKSCAPVALLLSACYVWVLQPLSSSSHSNCTMRVANATALDAN